jgi:hypothetical protein
MGQLGFARLWLGLPGLPQNQLMSHSELVGMQLSCGSGFDVDLTLFGNVKA